MLEVFTVISGALIVFLSLVLWANSDRFKSENTHESD
jgi:hypothetical protein